MIAFNAVMMANAPYSQSCFMIAAQVNIAAIIKNVSAILRYHCGDEFGALLLFLFHKNLNYKPFNHSRTYRDATRGKPMVPNPRSYSAFIEPSTKSQVTSS